MDTIFDSPIDKIAKIGQSTPENIAFLYSQLKQQQELGGVKHTASWTKDQDKILQEMAEKFANLGVKSIYDIGRVVEMQEVPDGYGDGGVPTKQEEKVTVFNKATGEILPVGPGRWEKGALTNASGSGFTWYNVGFTDEGVPVPIATKSQTGLSRFSSQVRDFVTEPGVLAALAVVFGPQIYAAMAPEVAAAGTTTGTTGATASFAPGSLQATLAELGVAPAAGSTAVPGSLQAALPALGVTPVASGGVSAGTAGLQSTAGFPTGGASYAPGSFQEFLAEEGLKTAGATPTPNSLQAYLSEIGVNPLSLGGAGAGISVPITNAIGEGLNLLDVAKGVSNIADALNPDQQQPIVMGGGGGGRPQGVDFSNILGLLTGKASLLPAAQQYQRGLLG